jgi:hypothetical protein
MAAVGSVDVALAMDQEGPVVWAAWAVTVSGTVTLYPPLRLETGTAAADWLMGAGGDLRRIGFSERRGRSRLLVESGNSYQFGQRLAERIAGSRAWLRYQPVYAWIEVSDSARIERVTRADGCEVVARRALVSILADEMRNGGTVRSKPDHVAGRWTRELADVVAAVPKDGQPEPGVRLACELAVWSAVRHAAEAERARIERLAVVRGY